MRPPLTNVYNVPDIIAKAVQKQASSYSKGDADYTGSELPRPPLLRYLEIKHDHEIVEDVTDRLWAAAGTFWHAVLEAAGTTSIQEARLSTEVTMPDGSTRVIGGKPDTLNVLEAKLTDWKWTSAFAVKDGAKTEWIAQVNVYGWILDRKGVFVDELEIGAWIRDWRPSEKARYADYPDKIQMIPIEKWPAAETEAYIVGRILEHEMDPPRDCTPEERWQKPTIYALMKQGRKSSVKNEETMGALELYAIGKGFTTDDEDFVLKPAYSIEVREGEYTRCKLEGGYCPARAFCPLMNPPGEGVEI